MKNKQDSNIDPRLQAMFEGLRAASNRSPQAAAEGKAQFGSELDAFFYTSAPVQGVGMWSSIQNSISETIQMITMRHRFVLITMGTLVVVALVLFGGASVTVSAAQGALPGDALYSLKTGLEQTQARLEGDAYDQALLYLKFAERRLDEISALIEEGRFDDLAAAVNEFEYYIQQAIESLGVVAANDPAQARELTMMMTQSLTRYTQMFTAMLARVPDNAQGDMQRAMYASQEAYRLGHREEIEFFGIVETITEEAWTVDGQVVNIAPWTQIEDTLVVGDYVKVHAYVDEDGSLFAREIELAESDDVDDDGPGDGRGDGRSNSNANDNDDDRGNSDSNGNDDANSNSNDNNDDDDDGNDGDDSGNSNDNDDGDGRGDSNSDDKDDDDDSSNDDDGDDDGDGRGDGRGDSKPNDDDDDEGNDKP